ncbi:hypothetical protein [Lewinella sp. W8]|uniref:hypothetical protein n=1 Tax=Lewinella sp. W8 TaxID=2528208 RepID=UPI0010676D1C|nr:hypothetical protein [Lewinella sp. W8]MTB52076.1 hypothetical protein [Lewinella sp. W8]
MIKKQLLLLPLIFFVSCQEDDPVIPEPELFTTDANPVYQSPLNLAADPGIVRSSDTLFLYFSAADYEIGVVYSLDDGTTWTTPDRDTENDYGALSGQSDHWDQTLETVDVIKVNGLYYMYYTGYRENESDNEHVENYEIGLATSINGIDFTRHPTSITSPILARDLRDDNSNDRHAMTSPAVQYVDGLFFMTYTGWNVAMDWTGPNAGFKILGATSTDGVNWTKLPDPLIESSDIVFSQDINESSLVYSPESNQWYIPFSTDRSIGLARSTNFSGPYDIYPQAIINPNDSWAGEVTAPDGIIEDGKLKLWFHGVQTPEYWPWVIGYAEADFPLNW